MPKMKRLLFALLAAETVVLLALVLNGGVEHDAGIKYPEAAHKVTSIPVSGDRMILQVKRDSVMSAISSREEEISDPLVFIGGVPSSGTTLMRVLLDAHPDIRCGEETRIIPKLLFMLSGIRKSSKEVKRLDAAGISNSLLTTAARRMVETIIAEHGLPAKYLCNKDPLSLKQMDILENMFPTAKFLLMVRDGRATAHSIMSRGVTISGVNHTNTYSVLKFWQDSLTLMLDKCKCRTSKCLVVYYEKLVVNAEEELRKILSFLLIPWHENVLKHHTFVNSSSVEISLSKLEMSSSQVVKPINRHSLSKWRTENPALASHLLFLRYPLLQRLGYSP